MKQTEQQAELRIFVFLNHTAQIKLNVGDLNQLTTIAN